VGEGVVTMTVPPAPEFKLGLDRSRLSGSLAHREDRDLRMEYARGHRDRLDLVILPDAQHPLLA
jgi:hypothetical protein